MSERLPLDDMTAGYLAGLSAIGQITPPLATCHRSVAYQHGWLNGRDDRLHIPRERASVLRARAAMIDAAAIRALANKENINE